jgi:small subunit ribosomal protein S19
LPKEFSYRGHTIGDLQQMSMDEFIRILPARQRRSLTRGLTADQRILMELVRSHSRNKGKDAKPIKTHCRDMVILPEMVGLTLLVHSGKEFTSLEIKPEMIAHYTGEFVITNKKVLHGTPGIGASRSSMYVPLK